MKDFDFKELSKEKTILGLNQVIQDKLEDESLIGISLKRMVGSASISPKNVFKDIKNMIEYTGYEFSKKSIDGYIVIWGN